MRKFNTSIKIFVLFIVAFSLAFIPPKPDEGMFPLSDIHKLNLNEKGLKISVDEIYNTNAPSMVDALVRIGGCTGSFVSNEGLIITNHHCVFGAVQRVSTLEQNYLENGFYAPSKEKEIPVEGLTARITVSYEDVSVEVLEAANQVQDVSERSKAISKKISEIVNREQAKDSTINAEVSEMFVGEQYVLFRYKVLKDIRLVYVPPRTVGEFGGESDNWIYPRHTGDFSFVRAYVSPDGKAVTYNEKNVPYKPRKFITMNKNGIDEGDFVFLLGYPGRTFKHFPSYFVEYHFNYQLPYIQELYAWLINYYSKLGENDPEFALEISSTIKGLANTEKNYRGKIQGIRNLNLIDKKRSEEKELQKFIDSTPELKEKYGTVIKEFEEVYNDAFKSGRSLFVLNALRMFSDQFKLANLFVDYKIEMNKPESERKADFKEANKNKIINDINNWFIERDLEIDKEIFGKIIFDAAKFDELKNVEPFKTINQISDKQKFLDQLFNSELLKDQESFTPKFLDENIKLEDINEPIIKFVKQLYILRNDEMKKQQIRDGKVNILMAKFNDAKRRWLNKSFVPDANSTLRLTFGYVKGYSPRDAVYYSPISSLKGMIEKSYWGGDYQIYSRIKELYEKGELGNYKHPKLNDVPIAFIYNTDTSGGNSGSPILDAYGRLVGVNFDRAFEATINDYAWSDSYSRSIGVDIRFILWFADKVSGAKELLKELKVN
jgi:metal-responsive CopG/Arc/MetJ family transcriptional regulator